MEGFNQLTAWFAKAWASASLNGRIMTSLSAILMVATIIGVAVWSSMPDYKLLRDGISPVVTADIVSALTAAGIPNQMNYSGTGVMVPAARWNEANVAISNLAAAGTQSAPGASSSFFPTPGGHADSVSAKERALESSLESLRVVKSADVHLAIPEISPFRSKRQTPSASVIVEPQVNQMISHETAMSIVHTVAAAVEGLNPKNVTLTSSDGSLMGNSANSDPAAIRREYISELESRLTLKAQDVLAPVFGPNRSVVRVTAEVDDFLDKVTTKQQIISAEKVTTVEKLTSSDQTGLAPSSSGIAGTASNDASTALAGLSSEQAVSGKSETTESTYDYPRTKEETREIGGQIRRLSISATIDALGTQSGDGNADPQAATILTQEQVENLIKSAVGFSAVRGDQLEVVMTKFSAAPVIPGEISMPTSEKWAFVSQLARNSSLGLAAIVALLLGSLTLKKMKPIEIPTSGGSQQRREILSELSNRVDDNPEAVSKILAAWIGQQSEADEPATIPMKKAA